MLFAVYNRSLYASGHYVRSLLLRPPHFLAPNTTFLVRAGPVVSFMRSGIMSKAPFCDSSTSSHQIHRSLFVLNLLPAHSKRRFVYNRNLQALCPTHISKRSRKTTANTTDEPQPKRISKAHVYNCLAANATRSLTLPVISPFTTAIAFQDFYTALH